MTPTGGYERVLTPPAIRAVQTGVPEAVAAAVIEFMAGPLVANPRPVGKMLRRELAGVWSDRRATYHCERVRDVAKVAPDRRMSVVHWIQRHSGELGRPLYYARLQRYLLTGRISPATQCATGREGVFVSSLGDIGVCGKRPANLGRITDTDPATALRRKREAATELPPGRCVDAVCLVLV